MGRPALWLSLVLATLGDQISPTMVHSPPTMVQTPSPMVQIPPSMVQIPPSTVQIPPTPEQHHYKQAGELHSPSYPLPYEAGVDCVYNISSPPSTVVHIKFTLFDVADRHPRSEQCLDAYLLVIVVDRQGKEHVGERLCGSLIPAPIETMQPNVRIQFVTTASDGQKRGFSLQYSILSEGSITQPMSFINPEDRELGPPCGGRTMPGQLTGEIISPGYPMTYPRNCTCNWLIRVEPRQRIYIRIVYFHLSSTIAECERASLTIIDGYKHEINTETREVVQDGSEARFCGSHLYYAEEGQKSFLSTANRLIVRLITREKPAISSEGERIGFKIIWTTVEGLIGDSTPAISITSQEAMSYSQPECAEFLCQGGQICVDQGHGICASRSQLCIHSSLVCNGIPNCVEGDFSDEEHCYSREILVASGIGFLALLLLILIFVGCDQWRKRCRLRQMVRESRAANGKPRNDARLDTATASAVLNGEMRSSRGAIPLSCEVVTPPCDVVPYTRGRPR